MHKRRARSGSAAAIAIAMVGLGLAVGLVRYCSPPSLALGRGPTAPTETAAPQSAPVASASALASGDAIAVNLQTSSRAILSVR